MTTTRMLGRVAPPWCPHCRTRPGPDCPDTGKEPRAVRRREQREWAREAQEALREEEAR